MTQQPAQRRPGQPASDWMAAAPSRWDGIPAPPVASPRPGSIPLRPLGVADIASGIWATIRSNWKALLLASGIAAVFAVTIGQLALYALAAIASDPQTEAAALDLMSVLLLTAIVASFIAAAAAATALVVTVTSEACLGNSIRAKPAWGRSRTQVTRLAGLALLTAVAVSLGLLALIVPGLYLLTRWAVAPAVVVLEDASVIGSLRRSWQLTHSQAGHAFGILFAIWASVAAVTGVLSIDISIGSVTPAQTIAIVLLGVVTAIAQFVVTVPAWGMAATLLYIDLRIRREGFDLVLAQATGCQPQTLAYRDARRLKPPTAPSPS